FSKGFDYYYDLREEFNSMSEDDVRKPALFQYLNKHGFNGLCRYNKRGEFNSPKGTVKKNGCNIPVQQLEAFSGKFFPEDFICGSFADYMEFDSPTLIYCDPPYVPMTASNFKYSADGFTPEDQILLKELAKKSKNTVV